MARRSFGPRIAARAALVASLVGSLTSCAARLQEPACAGPGSCEQGRSCVVGRCRPLETTPSPTEALRVVLEPADLAVVASSGSGGGGDELPESVTLGRATNGTVVLLFRFVPTWHEAAEVTSAFLVLEPLEGPPAVDAATFEMARILEPWLAGSASWGRRPRLDIPKTAGTIRARALLPVRIDVTPLVRDWVKRKHDDHGIALLARGEDAYGTAFSLGVSRGRRPRLEVYVR